jgi:hypothetical protein
LRVEAEDQQAREKNAANEAREKRLKEDETKRVEEETLKKALVIQERQRLEREQRKMETTTRMAEERREHGF